jgi:hypothetical protein
MCYDRTSTGLHYRAHAQRPRGQRHGGAEGGGEDGYGRHRVFLSLKRVVLRRASNLQRPHWLKGNVK